MNDLSFHDFQIPFLIRSNFSLSRPVIRGLGREISLPTCFFPLYFSLNVASLTLLSLLCLVLKTFSSMFTGANGVLAGETLVGEESIHAFMQNSIQHTGIAVSRKVLLSPSHEQTCWLGSLEEMAEIT